MKQFRATQNTPQFGPQSLYMRFIGKYIFMKGTQESSKYVTKLIADFEKKGATIMKGNGGWMRINIIKDHDSVKLGDVFIEPKNESEEEVENKLFLFFFEKYREAKFMVQEIVE